MEGFCKHINITRPPLITLQSAIKICSTTQQDTICLQDIHKSMLNKIMMFDSKSRELPRFEIDPAKTTKNILSIFKSLSHFASSSGDDTEVHPMDVFLFLFIQCNPIFRQTYITQVSKLQLSIPLITSYPSAQIPTFYIFSLKTLYKDYLGEHRIGRSFSVTEEKLPTISFIRIGECDKSQKSEMLNQIIGIPDYFFHRNQLGNVKKRYFLDGTVEIAWLLPTDEHLTHEDIFYNDPCMVLNLRGNAQSYSKQLDFITSVSTLVYVFISINEIGGEFSELLVRFHQDHGSKSVFLLYQGETLTSKFEPIIPIFLQNRSNTVLILNKHSLREDSNIVAINISDNLFKRNSVAKISLVDCIPIARRLLIPIDVDEHNIGVCQSNVDQMMHNISQQDSLAAVKQTMLPLQGDCWSRWTKAKRESHKCVLQEHIDAAVLEMTTAREEQLTKLRNPSPLLRDVINLCRELGYSQGDFYIVWSILKNSFNDLSKQRLPPLYEEYHKWHKLSYSTDDDTMDTHDKFAKQKESKEMLLSAGNNLARSSLGIEHIFRELGQVFESRTALFSRKQKMNLNRDLDFQVETLKDVAAKLLVVGHAFEIVDGDNNYIATEWVTGVLQSVAYIVGEKKKIFVLSILGTQSTGKSTLLNTMFGANFPVSSGRCTRGMFMQLIPIEEKIRSKLRYDYLVILDTEGLRTPELSVNSSFRGDNELATLSIGLGDVTILNMYGEGHTDVQDILQISIFAFIRMKLTYSKPRCIFVHQNVPDTHAQTNLLTARSNLIRTLDKITECAAQQENVQVLYNKFSDVINFHPDDEVFYFTGLFEGEPPKCRISAGYSRKASKLRQYVLECFSKHPDKKFTTICDWSRKLQTLWNSILKENFVFSYRNALEVTSRFQLDHKLSSWHSNYIQSLNSRKSESLNQLFNADFTQLDATWNRITSVLTQERISPSIEISSEEELMKNYFSTHENVEIFSKWKADTAEYFTKRREKHIDKMEKEFLMIYNLQKTKKAMDIGFIKSRQTIVSKVKELFFEMHEEGYSLSKRQFKDSKFQNVWEEWKSTIEVVENEIHDISRDLQRSLIDSDIIKSMCLMSTRQTILPK